MRGIGKQAFVFLSVLLLAVGMFSVAGAATPGGGTSQLNTYPAINQAINYTAYPSAGGPYLVAGTVRPSGLRFFGGAATANPDVFLVFNEDLTGGSLDGAGHDGDITNPANNQDIVPYGFTYTAAAIDPNWPNCVRLTGVAGQSAGDRVRLFEIGCLSDADGNTSTDLSVLTLTAGPVIVDITMDDFSDSMAVNQDVEVSFDADVDLAGSTTLKTAFGSMSEFNGCDFDETVYTAADDTPYFDLDLSVVQTHQPNRIYPGVSHLILGSGRVRWEDASTTNSTEQRFPINNYGPTLTAAYWNDVSRELWLVMNEPVDPASITGGFLDYFTTTTVGWDPSNVQLRILAAGDYNNVLIAGPFDLADGDPIEGSDTVENVTGVGALTDYQGIEASEAYTIDINEGPGMIRASYDDGQTSSRGDDYLYVWLSEPAADLDQITIADFDPINFVTTGLSIADKRNENNLCRVTITGFTNSNFPEPGSAISLVPGNNIDGDQTGDEADDAWHQMVIDESRPWGLLINENADLTYDRWNEGAGIDSIHVAWTESNGTDGDQYFLFFTEQNPSQITATWMNTYLGSAIPLGDAEPQVTNGVLHFGFTIDPGTTLATDGTTLDEGDQIYVLVAAADATGNLALRGDLGRALTDNSPASTHLFGAFLVGPLCPPRDFITDASVPSEADSADWDMDVIHIVGDSLADGVQHYIYGDFGAIPCDADSVVVYDGDDYTTDHLLGAGPVNTDGSFSFIALDEAVLDDFEPSCVYVFSKSGDTDYSTATMIRFQRLYATIQQDISTPFSEFCFDPWNPYGIYNRSDYVNVRVLPGRPFVDCGAGGPDGYGRSAVLHLWADFTQLDATAGNISGFSTPADSILFTSLGADQVDNDNDWENSRDLDDSGTIDALELFDDVGLDGVAGTNDQGEGDGVKTFGDAYVDENANGSYDPGETFVDRVNDADKGDKIFDPGEPNLDSNDSDEFGWYEIAQSSSAVRGTVRQGYQLANPIVNAQHDPYTPVPIWVEDNGLAGGIAGAIPTRTQYPASRDLPFKDAVTDYNRTLFHVLEHNGGVPEARFVAKLDLREPTVGEVSYLANETGATDDGAPNLIVPGNPVYNLGRYTDITSAHLSDRDVLYARMRLKIGSGWQDLALDPSTATGATNNDANADNFPGAALYDEDTDAAGSDNVDNDGDGEVDEDGEALANGFDEDHDGVFDEDGEGWDFSDREVAAAAQDSVADASNTNANGLHCQNDYTDNDNDAFFVYDSYYGDGLNPGGASSIGRVFWYNVDESTTNNFDDDNDGSTDESDEQAEDSGYGTGAADDNEDGIANGEAVQVPIDEVLVIAGGPSHSWLAIDYDPFSLGLYAPPTPGPGVDGNYIRVDAAHVYGQRPVNGNDTKNLPFYANQTSYTEIVDGAYEDLTYSDRSFQWWGYDLAGQRGDSTSAENRVFNWADTHDGDNLDWEVISEIYGLAADGETVYQLRMNGYDQAGNMRELWSEPISFTLDLTPPDAEITDCSTGGAPADFADVRPSDDGIQIYDAGKHPDDYTLTATADADADYVTFYVDDDPDWGETPEVGSAPVELGTDNSAPFTMEWPGDGMYTVNNYPAANADTVYFMVTAADEFGNTTQDEDVCVTSVIVIDGTNPTTVITQIDTDTDMEDGACVPPDSSINIFASIEDNDLDADGGLLTWCAGLDTKTGDRNIDDDDDGDTDEDDVDGDGIFTAGVDDAGSDGDPGTDDDEWNGSAAGGFDNLGETDDYITNDIVKVVFEYNPVGDAPDQGWLPIETVHGDPYTDPPQVIDWTLPVKATWNTLNLETGNYDVRAYSYDIEGNSDSLEAFITTVCIRTEPLRAYIQPEYCTGQTEFDLYAVHFIHDYEIDKVRFEYYADTNGNQCADDGGSWITIETDDGNNDADPRGDAVLYYPNYMGGAPGDEINEIAHSANLSATDYMFWDPEEDGYSSRDPIVYDDNDDGVYDYGDIPAIGDASLIPANASLTNFHVSEFWADADGDENLDPSDWIFRDNQITGNNNTLELWNVSWDATGLSEGNYLVRAIAIDQTNQEDVITYTCYNPAEQNPEEIELVRIDSELPDANLTTLTLPDGTELDVSSPAVQPYVDGSTKWMKICAEGSDDIARLKFEYSLNGGVDWTSIDVNNDDDFYSNLNGVAGFQSAIDEIEANGGCETDIVDEIFNDLNGNFLYDGESVDFVRYAGPDGAVDTPIGWPLCPLVGEDHVGDSNGDLNDDDDFDGVVDEDPASGTPPVDPGSPEDYEAPFCVYLDITSLPLWADVNVLFRATAYDQVCDIYRADPSPDILAVIIGENQGPEADIVNAEDLNGDEVDLRPAIHDDDGVDTFGADTDTIRVFVTAEDMTSVESVDLYYRLDPCCYPDLTIEELQWRSLSADGYTAVDAVYPYDFNVATDNFPDGAYQVYPRAVDPTGNATPAPANPWGFKKFANAGVDFAYVSTPEPPPAASDHAAEGDEYTIHGSLIDPAEAPTTAVQFYYAERQMDETIDATRVQPLAPYVSESLAETIISTTPGDGVVLTINGTLGTFHSDLSSVSSPTKYDFTVDAANNAIEFGARPDGADEILVSYNISSWAQIHTGDTWSPYTVAWTADEGGVPERGNPETDAYDLIAIARFDVNGDGEYNGSEGCDYDEALASEGNYLILDDQERPLVVIYGLNWSDDDPAQQGECPDWNKPGNPLFNSGDNLGDYDYVAKLSGVETDVFVVTADQGGGAVDSVDLAITAEELTANATAVTRHFAMTEYTSSASYIDIPVTFYEDDYYQWSPEMLENIVLQVSTNGGGSWSRQYEMTDYGTYWQATARFDTGETNAYRFIVDLVGDQQDAVNDARNQCYVDIGEGSAWFSLVDVPSTPFWYVHLDDATDLSNNAVHEAVATAFDNSGNTGNNLNSGMPDSPSQHQGQVVFVYDNTKPAIDDLFVQEYVGDDLFQELQCQRLSIQDEYGFFTNVDDEPFTDLNILAVRDVVYQYSPNNGQTWLTFGSDDDNDIGPWYYVWTPPNGETDGYDNDGDGLWDEEDERVYTIQVRAIAFDDGNNATYSDRQDPAIVYSIIVDAAEPTATLSQPRNGQVFTYDTPVTLSGTASPDWLPRGGDDFIRYVRFQVRMGDQDGSMYYVDRTYQGVGHDGYYDNGIDEIWVDNDHDDHFSGDDDMLYGGVNDDGGSDPDDSDAQFWFDLDPTPQDNSDFPRLAEPNNGSEYSMVWNPRGSAFIGWINGSQNWVVDEYVRGRLLATDCAGNDDTDADGYPPQNVLFLLNDETTVSAYVTAVDDRIVDPNEVLPIQGIDSHEVTGVVGPNCYEVTRANLYVQQGSGEPVLVGTSVRDELWDYCEFTMMWNAAAYGEGDYQLFVTMVDDDGNESDKDAATRITVRIDRTAPVAVYEPVGAYDGFTTTVSYTDDGVVDQSSLVIHPDMDTKDVMFVVVTTSDDVESAVLQYRHAAGDPQGLWRNASDLLYDASDAFDYEPNLNFSSGGSTYHVWRLHVEDFADALLDGGAMEFRALMTDEAGNNNALQTEDFAATVDPDDPTLFDWNDDSVTNQVEVGSTTHFDITLQDLDYTDVVQAQLQYRNVTDGGDWMVWGGDTDLTGLQIDTDNGMWEADFDWVAPTFVVHDTQYEFRVIVWDSAWNDATISHPNEFTLTVEDNAAPDRTKIVGIAGEVVYHADDCDHTPDPSDYTQDDDVFVDAYANGQYDEGYDFLISEGDHSGVWDCSDGDYDESDVTVTVGDPCNVWPRTVDEGYLNDANERNVARVAREVTIVGRTQADDDGIDAGIAYVVFVANRLNEDGSTAESYTLGKDEYAPFFPLYYWHLVWNTLATDVNGDRIYPDGTYRLGAWAVDQEGNVEDQSTMDWTVATVVVDNEEPATQMDADYSTPTVEKYMEVQRNSDFTLFARTLAPGSNAQVNDEDDVVTFWFKRSRDLNMEDSWAIVDPDAEAAGEDEDGNPDYTRPYSFDVALGQLTEPTDQVNNPPLAVGENYDFVASASDPNCNEVDHISSFADSMVSGVSTRYIKLHIIDTIAPCLEITSMQRKTGDTDPILNPTTVHARDFSYVGAKLLTGDRDLDHVEFVYRKKGDTTWNLADAALEGEGVYWELGEWDLRTLEHNTWYEIAAIGVDNVGNVCTNPDIVDVYVDYEAPPFTMVSPGHETQVWCSTDYMASGRDKSLTVQVDRGANNQHDDVWDVIWEVKASEMDSTYWYEVNSGADGYDDVTNTYNNYLRLTDLTELPRQCATASALWDMRVRVVDTSGNENVLWTWNNTVDLTEPNRVEISNIWWEGQDTTQDPHDGTQYTDVTAGTRVVVYGTASDDEPCIPAEYETGISVMKFQVAVDLPLGSPDGDANDGETWRELGTLYPNPPDHGDPSAVSDSVLWNTTGLAEGQYLLRVGVRDECSNPQPPDYTWSTPANVKITDQEPPIARIACWDSDIQPHGDNPPTLTTLYALAESDPSIVDVQFQYNVRTAGETTPVGEWINIGVQSEEVDWGNPTTQTLWYATIDLTDFGNDVTSLWLRALALDDAGNRYGDDPADVVPVLAGRIVRTATGMVTLEADGAATLAGGATEVESVKLAIEKPTNDGDDEPSVIITVKMRSADQVPRVVILAETALLYDYPSYDWPELLTEEDGELTRSLNDPTVWRGEMSELYFNDDCYNWTVCVTGLNHAGDTNLWVDMKDAFFREFPVSDDLGTNGTVEVPAYGLTPGVELTMVPGSINEATCLLVSPTYAPIASHDQAMYVNPVEGTAYHMSLLSENDQDFNNGYEPEVVIHYSDAAVAAALEGTQAEEGKLDVRRWDPNFENSDGTMGTWTGRGIEHVHVDEVTNQVSFRVNNLQDAGYFYDKVMTSNSPGYDPAGNIFQLFVPTGSGPVTFAGWWPMSPYVSDVWTNPTPEVMAYLKDQGGQAIDPTSVEVLIDGEYWATWYDATEGEYDYDCTDDGDYDWWDDDCGYRADWTRGNTWAYLQWVNGDHTVMELRYDHSTRARDMLAEGAHTMTIRYQPSEGTDAWIEGTTDFWVDATSPLIEFDGGWVQNPRLINLAGYMNPAGDSLQVKMYDAGSGILFRHERGWDNDGWDYDYGVKYDIWMVDGEDDQADIDEIEERVLLHQGTADDLLPWIWLKKNSGAPDDVQYTGRAALDHYSPARDTLMVPVPILGGGAIKDKSVIEIVWYSEKDIEENQDGIGVGCDVDTLVVNGQEIRVYGVDCAYDSQSQEMHIYNYGISDQAGNNGSRYVEQRFIVDMKAPSCVITSPAASVDPEGHLVITVELSDGDVGSGIARSEITVTDPEGHAVEIEDLVTTTESITGVVHGPLSRGDYTITVTAWDNLGNKCTVVKTVRVESAVLTMNAPMAYPNPFDGTEPVKIHFDLSKGAWVTAKVYDWAGNYVTTLAAGEWMASGQGSLPWAGEASDHTDLANGAYIVRVTATDGVKTEEANLKVVIWRE